MIISKKCKDGSVVEVCIVSSDITEKDEMTCYITETTSGASYMAKFKLNQLRQFINSHDFLEDPPSIPKALKNLGFKHENHSHD